MKGFKKYLTVFGLCFILSIQAVGFVYAEDTDEQGSQEEAISAGEYLEEIMGLIESLYVGGEVDTQMLVEAAVSGMTDCLDDYSTYFTKEEYESFMKQLSSQTYAIGVMYQQEKDAYPIITEVMEDTPAEEAGLSVGDSIISINGTDLKGKSLADITSEFDAEQRKNISLVISRQGIKINKQLYMTAIKVKTVYSSSIEDAFNGVNKYVDNSKIQYVRITSISDETGDDFLEELEKIKASGKTKLLLDLRGNTGGYVDEAVKICKALVPAGPIMYTKDKIGNVTEEVSELEECPFDKIVVLTNGMTASAAEIITSALQESGVAKVVGTTTYGKGVIQEVMNLPALGGSLKLTTHEYFTRNNNKINKVGITPDIIVNTSLFLTDDVTIDSNEVKVVLRKLGYMANNEEQVEAAIKKFQEEKELTGSEGLDAKTIAVLNLALYDKIQEYDEVMAEGYSQLIQ